MSFNARKDHPDKSAECLPDTRKEVLRTIEEWVDNPAQACIFWLHGMAGRGKTTIARTIARTYNEKARLGASFFFSRNDADASKADKFFTTMAVHLAKCYPALKPAIARAVEKNREVASETLRDQWEQLILQPLRELLPPGPKNGSVPLPLVFVVDALDE